MKTIYDFFHEHQCTEHEKMKLIIFLAELRYKKTLKMLAKIMRRD